jgi:hypothetical protein
MVAGDEGVPPPMKISETPNMFPPDPTIKSLNPFRGIGGVQIVVHGLQEFCAGTVRVVTPLHITGFFMDLPK